MQKPSTLHSAAATTGKEYSFLGQECELALYSVGQGLVVGPLVYACCFSPRDTAAELIHYFDLRDNASLKEHVRLQKYQVIKKLNYSRLGFFVKAYHPREVSNELLRGDSNARENITTLSYKTCKKLIKLVLARGFKIGMCYIGNCKACFNQSMQKRFYKDFPDINFQFDRKSIHNIPVLSCASILARMYREEQMWKWDFEEGRAFSKDFGLGVPQMAKTLQWLNECKDMVFGYPTVIRFSNETIQKILFFECVRINWFDLYNLRKGENEADAFETPTNNQQVSPFKQMLIERQQMSPAMRYSFSEMTNMSRYFRL
ncbi:hypothetical protein FGO68_gene14715 [Halteria grandinella]|uniref:Ribonuclease n=1 Tax=Halteria grandinella TaxID=5974 RepID=A0A8J8NLL9_HALGN|nr:hypothetical protein FGO68_gene14715 [Halteria grandinella]